MATASFKSVRSGKLLRYLGGSRLADRIEKIPSDGPQISFMDPLHTSAIPRIALKQIVSADFLIKKVEMQLVTRADDLGEKVLPNDRMDGSVALQYIESTLRLVLSKSWSPRGLYDFSSGIFERCISAHIMSTVSLTHAGHGEVCHRDKNMTTFLRIVNPIGEVRGSKRVLAPNELKDVKGLWFFGRPAMRNQMNLRPSNPLCPRAVPFSSVAANSRGCSNLG
jgi:hypothetical protein